MKGRTSEFLDLRALGEEARAVRKKAGLSQMEAAERVGTSQPNVSAAESGAGTRFTSVAKRIIEEIGGKRVSGPFYQVSQEINGSRAEQ